MIEHRVAAASQAELLLNVALRPLLVFLMQRPRTVSQVAGHLGVNLNRAHYLVMKLERAGIAVVAGVQARAGRAVKSYVVAPHWFIPFEVTGAATLEESANAQIVPRMQQMIRNAIGLVLGHTSERRGYWLSSGALTMGDDQGPADALFLGDEPFVLNIGQLNLSREDALRFKERLRALVAEFEVLDDPAEPPYAAGFMLVRGPVI